MVVVVLVVLVVHVVGLHARLPARAVVNTPDFGGYVQAGRDRVQRGSRLLDDKVEAGGQGSPQSSVGALPSAGAQNPAPARRGTGIR